MQMSTNQLPRNKVLFQTSLSSLLSSVWPPLLPPSSLPCLARLVGHSWNAIPFDISHQLFWKEEILNLHLLDSFTNSPLDTDPTCEPLHLLQSKPKHCLVKTWDFTLLGAEIDLTLKQDHFQNHDCHCSCWGNSLEKLQPQLRAGSIVFVRAT